MTIIEAIKSGKRFKRPFWGSYYDPGRGASMYGEDDLIATDWEIEIVKKELSADDIRLAIGLLDECGFLPKLSCLEITRFEKSLIEQLGLE